jgi:hypothetical protein
MSGDHSYYQKWYEENKEERNRRRREKYAEDAEYRERVMEHSREYRERQRKRSKVKLPRFQKPKDVELPDGSIIQLFSVGAFAQLVQRSVQSITHWEKREIIPPTPYRDSRGFRYFTRPMMAAVIREIGGKRRLFPVDDGMYDRIEEAWKALGIPVNEVDLDAEDGPWDEAVAKTRTVDQPTDDDVFEDDDEDEY